MRFILKLISLLLIANFSIAQSKNQIREGEKFAFIESSTDTSALDFIRTFKCISKKGDDLPSLLRAITVQGKNLGANCYKYLSFSRDSSGVMTLILETFHGNDSILDVNFSNHEKNTVYLFGDDNFNSNSRKHELNENDVIIGSSNSNSIDKIYSFRINGELKSIHSGCFYKYQIEKNGQVKINNGGMTGITLTIDWGDNKNGQYFSMTGFALSGNQNSHVNSNGTKIFFSTGKFRSIDNDLGRLLVSALTPVDH